MAQQFAADLYNGVVEGLPGQSEGYGRAAGDFDLGNAQHHGTPIQRRDALLTGFRSGDPASCAGYVDATAA